ncbi:hypothetical protein [Neobacillus sp. NPDC093127]|uniref:hypothetical protein n=1 Tax=Neobacillus sp. NPDC093127 TaxID=3364296 RepID=UPI003802BE2E
MTAIIGFIDNNGVFVAADRRRTNGIQRDLAKKIFPIIGSKIYITSAGSEMDSTRNKVISEITKNKVTNLKDVVTVVQREFSYDFKLLQQEIIKRNEERTVTGEPLEKEPELEVILFGIDENQNTFIFTLDSDDDFININKKAANTVYGTGTFDNIIQPRAEKYFNHLKNGKQSIKLDEWAYVTMKDFVGRTLLKETISFPIDYVLIISEGIFNGVHPTDDETIFAPQYIERFNYELT